MQNENMYSAVGYGLIIAGVGLCGFVLFHYVATSFFMDWNEKDVKGTVYPAIKGGALLIGAGVVVTIAGMITDALTIFGLSLIPQLMIMAGLSFVGLFLAYRLVTRTIQGDGKNKSSANLAGKVGAYLLAAGMITVLVEKIGYALSGK